MWVIWVLLLCAGSLLICFLGYEECEHDWEYDEEESEGPWTGYIERCVPA